jgi:hypothetical protein
MDAQQKNEVRFLTTRPADIICEQAGDARFSAGTDARRRIILF